jgi:transposase
MAGKPRRNPVTDEQIVASYRETKSVYKTAALLGIGATTVHRVLMKHNEPRSGLEEWRKNATKFRGQEDAIREAYEAGATYAQLRQKFGDGSDSDYALKQALRRAGAKLRETPALPVKSGEIDKLLEMNAAGMGQTAISLALGRSQSFISRLMRKHSIRPLSEEMKGRNHPSWTGGRWIDASGYVRVWLDPSDPLASMCHGDAYVLEHRLVMARRLGRPLTRKETVHHINGNRTDNRIENLQLRRGKHGKHAVLKCACCGSYDIIEEELAEEHDD